MDSFGSVEKSQCRRAVIALNNSCQNCSNGPIIATLKAESSEPVIKKISHPSLSMSGSQSHVRNLLITEDVSEKSTQEFKASQRLQKHLPAVGARL